MPIRESEPIKFAYWVPNVSGGLVISDIEQRTGWDIDYNVKLAQIAEQWGFDYALSQIRFTAGYGAEFQHEPVAFSHALLAATKKLKVIAALLPGPWSPAVAAKQIATISHLTNGRVAVNVVSGWFRGEFAAIGQPWLDHDERYRRSEEFIRALRGIWTQDGFTYKGFFYHFDNYSLKPKPLQPLPEVFQGGSSRAARDMASRVSDWYFTNGNTPEEIAKQVDDAVAAGANVRLGGKTPDQPGWFYPPTVVTEITKDMALYTEEVFGPVASMYRASGIDEAIEIANATTFGLGSNAWTNDEAEQERFIDDIEAGQVFINGMTVSYPELGFGGVKRSGYGRELAGLGIRAFCNAKTVWVG